MNLFGKSPQELVYELIERDNSITLNRDASKLELLTALPADHESKRNTQITVSTTNEVIYIHKKNVYYNRVDLVKWFVGFKPYLDLRYDDTSHSVLNRIYERYGIKLDKDDVVLSSVDTTNLPYQLTFKIKPGCIAYTTSEPGLLFTEDNDNLNVDKIIQQPSLRGIEYPSSNTAKPQGAVMTFGCYSKDKETLSRYYQGQILQVPSTYDWVLVETLNNQTKEKWTFGQNGATLYNARIAFNGTVLDAMQSGYSANGIYQKVLIIELGANASIGGYVLIHYDN